MSGVLHDRVSPTTLGVVRAVVFVTWLVVVVPDPLAVYGHLPAPLFHQIGVFRVLPRGLWLDLLKPGSLAAFKIVLVAVIALAAVGVRPYRPIAAGAAVMLTVDQALVRGFAVVNHDELTLLVVTYLLVAFPAADGFALARRRTSAAGDVYSAALLSMALFLLVPYCLIAAHRLSVGFPDLYTGTSLPSWLASLHSLNPHGRAAGLWVLRHPPLVTLFKLGFLISTTFELLAPLCLVLPRLRRVWIVFIVFFHILNSFALGVFFWENIVLVLLLLSDTDRIVGKLTLAVARIRSGGRPRPGSSPAPTTPQPASPAGPDGSRSGGELAADLRERPLLGLVEHGERVGDPLGVLGKRRSTVGPPGLAEHDGLGPTVGRQAPASDEAGGLQRRDDLAGVGLRHSQAGSQSSHLELAAGCVEDDEDGEAGGREPAALELGRKPTANAGLGPQERVERAVCQRITRDEPHRPEASGGDGRRARRVGAARRRPPEGSSAGSLRLRDGT